VFGLARNSRLVLSIGAELSPRRSRREQLRARHGASRNSSIAREKSWSRLRRVIAEAEQTAEKANPRFIVTSLPPQQWAARAPY